MSDSVTTDMTADEFCAAMDRDGFVLFRDVPLQEIEGGVVLHLEGRVGQFVDLGGHVFLVQMS